jgi:hypothetical protein
MARHTSIKRKLFVPASLRRAAASSAIGVALAVSGGAYGAAGVWHLERQENKMDKTSKLVLSTEGDERFPGGIGRSESPDLIIRCERRKTELIVDANVVLGNNTGELHEHAVRIRFDDGKPERLIASEATSGTAVFLPNARGIIKRMFKAKTLLVELTPFRYAPSTTTFTIAGLDFYSPPLKSECGVTK